MFNITSYFEGPAKGFHMTFANGWTVSVQWGHGNYCENKYRGTKSPIVSPSVDAEIAAWDASGEWHYFDEEGDTVKGYCTPEDVAAFIAEIAAK